jgi:DDE superfamily endonuclease
MLLTLAPIAPLFSRRVWRHALVLVAGAILAPGRRTVTAVLRAMGLERAGRFERYHRVLSRARWSGLAAVAADPATTCATLAVANWYGAGERTVEVASDTAVWYHSGLRPVPLRWVLIRDPRGKFDTQALLCTDPAAAAEPVLAWVVLRWQLAVTFEEARRHLGIETQRQGSDPAIRRTTPALLGLFSLVTLLAHPPMTARRTMPRRAAWYAKAAPTFADALAPVRREVWTARGSCTSAPRADMVKIPRPLLDHLTELLCYAA